MSKLNVVMPRWVTGIVLGVGLSVSVAGAQLSGGYVESIGSHNGGIDWTQGILYVEGNGAPPANAVNAAQARMMAERAAKVDAYRNLVEVMNGVRVEGMTLVENMTVSSDIVKTQVQGILRGAQVQKSVVAPDGGVTVTMAIKLTGELANVLLPKQVGGGAPVVTPAPAVPVMPAAPSAPAAPAAESVQSGVAYTGLIVDARGTGVRPAMAPKIVNEEGREVYGSAFVNRQYAVEQGMVGYIKDIAAAQANNRVTNRPLLVKALKTSGNGKTDLVISNGDAQSLHGLKDNLNFLEKARVMIVLD